ncbi:hypothetical protein CROQUDRAFT_102302 [Cronartium quercuum f. sp. fusiforme G11]|uniref:Uncharacterized protein n=1 Tax=Cronartium quercuum f. sp. fusiforme G11 TaxID=708437 RepID=A0A9P6T528_9BASI|nr:hypothetical protein CROQUDRAFT_102302 [Cronartium quercuum f. sp. fusiforme G11]
MSSLGPAEIKDYLNISFDFEERGLALKRALEIALKPKAWEADLDGKSLDSKFDVLETDFYVDHEAPALPPRSHIDEMNEMDEIFGISFQSKHKCKSDCKPLSEAQKFSHLLNAPGISGWYILYPTLAEGSMSWNAVPKVRKRVSN